MVRGAKDGSVSKVNKPITIAGGGLAGLSLGIALRRDGIPVRVHEAGHYPRHRVCGEFISGLDGKTLQTLGIEACFADARQNQSIRWFRGDRCIYSNELPEPALGISRHRLDERLSRRFVETGGNLIVGSRKNASEEEGLVWAAGRRATHSDWIGLKCHVLNLPLEADLEMHLGQSGYVGLSRVENQRVNVCGLFRRHHELKSRGIGWLLTYLRAGGLDALAERLEGADMDEASFLGAAGFALGPQRTHPELLSLGDSEAIIPPFTGHGMAMAFQAAEAARLPLVNYAHGKRDWASVRLEIQRSLCLKFRRRLSAASFLHPCLMTPTGRGILEILARHRCLPFRFLLKALH